MKKENNIKPKPFHLLINIFYYIFFPVFILLILNVNAQADKREVRVGVYANKPLVYQDENGEHKGLSVDVLRFAASEENWKLEFVLCSWSECLEMLKRGENDIQVIIAKTPERAKIYDFTSQSLYTFWAQIFIHPDSDIQSWTDLKGKNVAVYKDDLFSEAFKKLIRKFDIDCNLFELENYQAMLKLIKEKKADAGVFIQTFAEQYAIRGIVRRTPIMFNPVPVYYAFPKGKVPELVTAIDRHLKMLKEDKDSIYYHSLDKIFGEERELTIPHWIKWILIVAPSLILLSLIISVILRRQVKARTAELLLKNTQLEEEISERKQAEVVIRKIKRALKTVSEGNKAIARAREESDLMYDICRIIVEIGGYRLAWVGFAEHNQEKNVRPMSQSGFEEGYLDTVKITWADTDRGHGPTGTAIRTMKPSIVKNILTDPDYHLWRADAIKRGYGSSLALPLVADNQCLGALNIYASEPNAFDTDEVKLLMELADGLVYGIKSLRTRAEAVRAGHLASLGELAAGVAHEINNPITGIISFAEILKDQCNEQGQDDEIPTSIIEEGDRVAIIVKNLLSFARDRKEKHSPVHVRDILANTLGLAEIQIKKDGIKFTMDVPVELPKIKARSQEIQQVFLNIISNARYALNQRYPGFNEKKLLEIKCETTEIEGQKHVRTTIYDGGTGIPDNILDKISNPFFTTKPHGEGTGLGLSISHGIIKNHGGRLWFESVEGEFTKVMVDLPVDNGWEL